VVFSLFFIFGCLFDDIEKSPENRAASRNATKNEGKSIELHLVKVNGVLFCSVG